MRRTIAPSYVRSRLTCSSADGNTKKSELLQNDTLTNTRAVRSTASIISILSEANTSSSSNKAGIENEENITPEIQHKSSANETDCTSQKHGMRVFSVLWGKQSKKKHKTYEEDGTLEVGEKSIILKDMDGKIIGQSSGLKAALLQEGSHLNVGSKEVEILELITADDSTTAASRNKRQEDFTEDDEAAHLAKRSRKPLLQRKPLSKDVRD